MPDHGEGWNCHPVKAAAVKHRDGMQCRCCGYKDRLKLGAGLTIEHIVPRSQGGAVQGGLHEESNNLTTLCNSCNARKNSKDPRQFNAFLKARGLPPINYDAIRATARKKLDLDAGKQIAEAGQAYRKANGIKAGHWSTASDTTTTPFEPPKKSGGAPGNGTQAGAPPKSAETQEKALEKKGPGIHHGGDGKFMAGRTLARGFGLSDVRQLAAHYQDLQDLGAWTIECSIVPGLKHHGEDAWAVVESDPGRRFARVKVRDLIRTPLPAADPWTDLKLTLAHEMGHLCVDEYLRDPTPAAEELLVERFARAQVRAPAAEARIMSRSWRAAFQRLPVAIRARLANVSARATARARGGQMDPKLLKEALDALIAGEAEKCMEILKGMVVAAASGGSEPEGDDPTAPREEPKPMDPAVPREEPKPEDPAMRAVARRMSATEIRARKAADAASGVAIRARLREVEAVDGLKLSDRKRKELSEMNDLDAFERRIGDIMEGRASNETRARSGTQTPQTPGSAGGAPVTKYNADALIKEGIHPTMARMIANEPDPASAELALTAARGRVVSADSPWPTKGGAA